MSATYEHAPPTEVPTPPPFHRSEDDGRSWTYFLGCTICKLRVKVSRDEYVAAVQADLEGTLCETCLSQIC